MSEDDREKEPPFHLRYTETPAFLFGEYGMGNRAITLTRGEAEFLTAKEPGKYTIEPAACWGEKMSRKYFEYYLSDAPLAVGDRVNYRDLGGTQIIGTIEEVGENDSVLVTYPPGCGWVTRWEDPSRLKRVATEPNR